MFEQALELIKKYDTIIIHRHTNPDGDAIGSQIGLKNIIKDNFPNKNVYVVGDKANRYSFMEQSVMDEIGDEVYNNSLAIILDSATNELINDKRYTLASQTLRFDHHIFCEKIADVEYVDTTFESCCGLITMFAKESNLKLSPISAKSLYTGMVTDSGRFGYDSVNSQTFMLASFLVEQPFDIGSIYTNLYSDELSAIQNKAKFTLKIKLTKNNVAYIYNTKEEVLQSQMDVFSISRGMVGTMANIKGVNVWVNFTECDDGVACELRSNKYNINAIAVKYGGGGHLKASGAMLKDKQQAMAMLEDLNELVLSQGE